MAFVLGMIVGFIIGITVIAAIACVMAAGDSEKIDNKKEFIGVLTRLVFQDQLNDNSEAEDNSSGDFPDMLEDGEEDD